MDSIDNETRKILKQYIERIERLEEEKNNINNDIKDLLVEAKAKGFVPNIIRQVIRARKMDTEKLNEQEALFEHLTIIDHNTRDNIENTLYIRYSFENKSIMY